ncbi:MAG: Gp138 family membrane-puncturing spike protein [Elusimicrobia bacterium]|nr:Gp138 family membrane-puncturing spike protein [Elusimicrobiota bacterium]
MGAVLGSGLTVVEPKLEDLFQVFGRKLKIELNCVKIGTIQAIDYTTMTASVQVVFQQQLRSGAYQNVPVLTDCPVVTPQGGGYSLQFPIEVGDTALVLFADRNIDNWYTAGGVMPPADGRLHALSDAIAIVGLNALASPLSPAPSSSEARLIDKAGTTKVGLSGGKITIQNAGGSLLTTLNNLVTALNTLNAAIAAMTSASITAGTPQAAAAANATAIAAVTTALGALLY